MCGIFAIFNLSPTVDKLKVIENGFINGKHRGPEFSTYENVMINANFGFHRLAINGLNKESNQPLRYNNIVLICNGEIYNHKELYNLMHVQPETESDCEVIIHMYLRYGIEQTLQMLDGVFSFCLIDYSLTTTVSNMYIARDPYGIRPLYIMQPTNYAKTKENKDMFVIASELKMLSDLYHYEEKDNKTKNALYYIKQFVPGSYSHAIMKQTSNL